MAESVPSWDEYRLSGMHCQVLCNAKSLKGCTTGVARSKDDGLRRVERAELAETTLATHEGSECVVTVAITNQRVKHASRPVASFTRSGTDWAATPRSATLHVGLKL